MVASSTSSLSCLRKAAILAVATALAFAGVVARPATSLAGDGPKPELSVELNNLAQAGEACRVTFMASNGLGADLDAMSLEIVVFDRDGIVRHLTIFDFGALPAGRARVRRFELPKTGCGSIGRILVNGASACRGEGLAKDACQQGLGLTNRTDIEFLG